MRKYLFYDIFYYIIRTTGCRILKKTFRFSGETIPDIEGPLFVLCNHNTDVDFLLISGMCKKPLDFVATESTLRLGGFISRSIRLFKPILHDKGASGLGTLKRIVERIREGRSVLLFPEGNRSFNGITCPVSNALGGIAKITGATLVIYRITGGYLTTPRWGTGLRRGRMKGQIMHILSPVELKTMKADEIQHIIVEGLLTDAYEEQKNSPVCFKGKNRAMYLESLLFICPCCRKAGTLRSRKNNLYCECGYDAEYTEYGYLVNGDGKEMSITQLYSQQKEILDMMLRSFENDQLFSDKLKILKIDTAHRILEEGSVMLEAYPDHLRIGNDSYAPDHIASIDIVQRNLLGIHIKGEPTHYELSGSPEFNAVKYRLWHETTSNGTVSDSSRQKMQ
ncbi:MAG: 1-acyl-sn-glycerol-3-phosphate acyltransferase [Lachnospiraceae bacterium]|nr:1-acyl-sn-glycerol-3-phosphate acyltransferase [Lachnospiraceae bacterium]